MRRFRVVGLFCLLIAATGCDDSDTQGQGPEANSAPVASAGADQGALTGSLVNLDGSASSRRRSGAERSPARCLHAVSAGFGLGISLADA